MPHWWTPCLEAYPIRMPERTPPRIRSDRTESAVEPQFVKAMPLREVVADCEKRWFEQTLKAAKNGDVAMQSLVGQMFCSGYGVTANLKKVTTMAGLSFFSRNVHDIILYIYHLVLSSVSFAGLFFRIFSANWMSPVLCCKITFCTRLSLLSAEGLRGSVW
jgi:hypothetical protein